MATSLDNRPDQESDSKIQQDYDDKFNELTSPEHMSKDGKEPDLYDREANPDQDGSAPLNDRQQTETDNKAQDDFSYEQDGDDKKPLKSKIKGAFSGRKKWGWLGGGASIVSLLIMGFSTLGLELVHIKEVLNFEVGKSSDTVLSSRTSRVYSRMFFFREDGQFDGYRDRGLFGFLENKRTTRVLDDMRARGFVIDPEFAPDGRWTGRVNSISLNGEELANRATGNGVDAFATERRNAIKQSLSELYPEKSRFWRSRQARALYRRYNLDYLRGGWLRDTRLFTGVESMEFRLRQTLRTTLFGDRTGARAAGVGLADSGEGTTPEETDLRNQLEGVSEDVDQARAELEEGRITQHATDVDVTDPSNTNKTRIITSTARGAAGGALRGVSILGAADSACEVKRFAGLLKAGAIVLRSRQLISYATIFFSAADAQKAGFLNSNVHGAFMNLIKQDGTDGKHGLYSSGAYGGLIGNNTSVNPINRDHYSVGGGFTGPLGIAHAVADEDLTANSCGFFGNIFVRIGGAIVGIGAAIISGGASLIASVGTSVAISIAAETFRAIAAPMITEMLVGNIISWDETGEQYMDALVSGTGAMYGAQGANHGMKPMTVDEYVAIRQEFNELESARFASTPWHERMFSLDTPNSLAFNLFTHTPKSLSGAKNDLIAYLSSPLSTVAGLGGSLFSNNAPVYAQEVSQCPDELVIDNDIATDPFCNPVYGESMEGLAIEPDDNFIYMVENEYVDDDGNPQEEYVEFVERCVNDVSDYYNFNQEAGNFTFDDYCMLEDERTLHFRAFSAYRPLVEAINDEMNGVVGVPGYSGEDINTQINEIVE